MEAVSEHGAEGALETGPSEVRESNATRTGGLTDSRKETRRLLAILLKHLAEKVIVGGYRGIGRCWNCDESLVRRIAKVGTEETGRVQSDLWPELPKDAFAVYRKLMDDIYEHGPLPHLSDEEHALRIAELAGRIATDVREENRDALATDLAQLEGEAHIAQPDLKLVPVAGDPS